MQAALIVNARSMINSLSRLARRNANLSKPARRLIVSVGCRQHGEDKDNQGSHDDAETMTLSHHMGHLKLAGRAVAFCEGGARNERKC